MQVPAFGHKPEQRIIEAILRFYPPGWWFYAIAYCGRDSLMLCFWRTR